MNNIAHNRFKREKRKKEYHQQQKQQQANPVTVFKREQKTMSTVRRTLPTVDVTGAPCTLVKMMAPKWIKSFAFKFRLCSHFHWAVMLFSCTRTTSSFYTCCGLEFFFSFVSVVIPLLVDQRTILNGNRACCWCWKKWDCVCLSDIMLFGYLFASFSNFKMFMWLHLDCTFWQFNEIPAARIKLTIYFEIPNIQVSVKRSIECEQIEDNIERKNKSLGHVVFTVLSTWTFCLCSRVQTEYSGAAFPFAERLPCLFELFSSSLC